jgi:hypothetical protein
MILEEDLESAHNSARNNRSAINSGAPCGCFHCLNVFPAAEIRAWIDDDATALCPICGVDAVLSSEASPVTPAFLRKMHDRWFGKPKTLSKEDWQTALNENKWPSGRS